MPSEKNNICTLKTVPASFLCAYVNKIIMVLMRRVNIFFDIAMTKKKHLHFEKAVIVNQLLV